ncbi:MAG TPA: hypothetical protein VGB04_11730 [Allosphingosinicella sp.]|jgi:hypothetical protein
MFDLAAALAKKQEVESARLDEYWFRHRARKMRILGASLAGRVGGKLDPRSLAEAIAVKTDEVILEELRAHLLEPVPDREWHRLVLASAAEARHQLVAEYGNPDPHRLA